jgi:hypothetical protein
VSEGVPDRLEAPQPRHAWRAPLPAPREEAAQKCSGLPGQ